MFDNNQKFILAGLGEILWDILPTGRQLGGAPANFAYHCQALGGKAVVVSCVGNDKLGNEILNQLQQLGLEHKYIAIDTEHPTGTVTVELDENGKPDYIIHQNVAWDFIPQTRQLLELAQSIDAVCFGSLCQRSEVSRNTVREFLRATKPECLRVFDINIRQSFYSRHIIQDMLELSNVLKLNDEELPLIADMLDIKGSETDILQTICDRCELNLIALTKGSRGSRLYTPTSDSSHAGFPADIADTVGAGDSFTAAITLGLLRGDELDKINERANRLAGFVCSQKGATPKLPHSLKKELC
jgi:fructokinase